jgi:hypothetical protein
MMHHLVLWRRTTGWGCHRLPLLALLVSTDHIIRNDSVGHKLRESPASVERKALIELGGQAPHEAHLLLSVGVDMFWRILYQMVEQLGVVVHRSPVLLKIHELMMLPHHNTYQHMLSAEGLMKLSPLDLIHRTSGGEVGPACPGITEQLLSGALSLLVLSVAEEPKLELNGVKPRSASSGSLASAKVEEWVAKNSM